MKVPNLRLSTELLLFVALFGCYVSLSPGTIAGMGYTREEIQTADRMFTILDAWRKDVPAPPMQWPRHGLLPIFFDVPFVGLAKLIAAAPDYVMSFEPVLVTAALGVLIFLWLRKLTSPGVSLLLALTAAFGTMLWPYAYIGLETKQSFFVLLAGYMALARGKIRGWPQVLLFAAVCGLAISLKSTGFTLAPAIAYVVYVQFRDEWRSRRNELAAVILIAGVLWMATAISRIPFWTAWGGAGASETLRSLLIESPFFFFTNLIGIFGSPNRGLFVTVPVLLLALYAVPRALRSHRREAIFALLITGGVAAWLSLLRSPTDEVWGNRYMHTAIAPLIICIGAVRARLNWRKEAPLMALAALGVVIAFLGCFFYYGSLHLATQQAGRNAAEWIGGDRVWNPIVFHARLFNAWWNGSGAGGPVLWTPRHLWLYEPPPNMPPVQAVDLRPYCRPQALLLRLWEAPKSGRVLLGFLFYMSAIAIGLVSLVWAIRRTVEEERRPPPGGEIGGRDAVAPGVAAERIAHISREFLKRLEQTHRWHPAIWGIAGGVLFWVWGGLLVRVEWNAVEMMMGRNLLQGYGLAWSPLDPPALWRPPLGALLCALIEVFTTDPHLIYRVLYAASLTTFLVTSFYSARALWGTMAAHLAGFFIITSGALTSRLVTHVHSISHVVFLLAAGPALLLTVKTFAERTRLRLLAVGICWGLLYLARWETLLFFAATLGVLLYVGYAGKKIRGVAQCAFAVLGFAALFVPAAVYQSWAKARYGIWGASALSTFYTGEAWIVDWSDPIYGDEDLGFAKGERLYGSFESNRGSLPRAIARNPAAFRERLRINIRKFTALFLDERKFFDPAWLLLLPGLVLSRVGMRRGLPLAWLLLLFLCSATICFFHIDSRYVVISAPFVVLLLGGGAAAWGDWAARGSGAWRSVVMAGLLLFLILRSGSASYDELIAAVRNPEREAGLRDAVFARGLAEEFRKVVQRPAVLHVEIPDNSKFERSENRFLVSYFAGAGILWPKTPFYPRDKILSEIPRDADYTYFAGKMLYETDILLKSRPVAKYAQDGEVYALFPRLAAPAPYGDAEKEKIRAMLARDFPELLRPFEERNAAEALTAVLDLPTREKAGPVGCGVLAFRPDGRDDLVFPLKVMVKPQSPAPAAEITYIELQRKDLWGVVHTADSHFLLGVAESPDGPLLNQPNGAVKFPVQKNNDFWLYACDDGANRPGTYRARVRIGRDGWVESKPVTLPASQTGH